MSIPSFGRKPSQPSPTIARDVERQPQSQHRLIEVSSFTVAILFCVPLLGTILPIIGESWSFYTMLLQSVLVEMRVIDQGIHLQQYPLWWSRERVFEGLQALPEDPLWNSVISIMALAAIVWVACETDNRIVGLLDILYNVLYAVHVLDSAYNVLMNLEVVNADIFTSIGFILDILSFSHFVIILETGDKYLKLGCYYLRLHRPFRYFWSKNNYNINGSVIGTTLMYCYMFLVLRVTWALVWFYTWDYKKATEVGHRRVTTKLTQDMHGHSDHGHGTENTMALCFFYDLYLVNKMFIPIGPSDNPRRDSERIVCMLVMISGCLVVSGAAVASLSLVFSIYMKHEEYFRARYRLIMREMKESHVPQSLREKVEAFYKMYWQKQKAVSTSELLLEFPPTIPASIYTDIYFKATQKSRILRELSYQFLTEVAKTMHTIHYIPGDTIIKRSTRKSSIIYITYGDVEMLTAEDDSTAILRMTRGTILSPCGPCPIAGCARAHVEIRAATFCTAHVLGATELWKTAVKHGRESHHGAVILASFDEHFDKVKRHFFFRAPDDIQYKSSILHFKQNLMNLQESKDEHGDSLLSHDDVMLEIAGCYVIRNRQYSSLTDETDAICLRSTFPCILQPTSSLQVAWHSFVVCIIIVVCITHPYNLVYKKEISLEFRFYDYVVTVIYALDLIVHLSTGANVEDGIPISLAQTSSQQARSRWFVLDIVGTLPIFEFIGEGHFAGINKLLRLPKVFRVLKALEDECVYHSNVLRFFSFSLMILISCYLIAALQQGYMCFQYGWCQVSNFTHSPHWRYAPADDKKVKDSLVFSLYWSISMLSFTSHMESWVATYFDWNSLYTMLVLEVCIVLHIFIEAVYSATIMVTTAMRENFDASIEMVQKFLARNEVDPELRKRFITYLQLCWYNDKSYSASHKKKTIFHDLPPHVYQDIVTRQRSKYILCIPFIKLLLRDDLKNVSSNAKMFYTSPNEILLNTGDITNEMYVIKQGICEVLSPETMDVVAELGVRSHFGVLECLLRLPAFYTIRAVTHVQVFCISRKHLANALQIPKINDAIEYAKQQPEYSSLQVGRDRFVLYQPDSPVPNTVRFQLPRKHEEDLAFLQPFNKLGFLSVLRYIFPRFSIRPDGRYLVHCEWLRATCALLSAIVFPGYPYLALQWPWLYFVAVVLDCSAYFDLFQRMLVGYFNDKGILVYHPSSTAEHYIRGAFLIDLFGCLPLEFLESPWRDSYQDKYKITMTKQVLMLNRLLQLYRTPSALLGLAKHLRRDILLVINAIPLFMALINVLTCFMVLYSVSIYYSMNSGNWYIVPIDDKGGSWIILFRDVFRFNIIETPWNLHLTCLFWVIYETTTTGYNCLNPSNLQLMHVLLCGMIIGTLIITYFSVRIISVRANVNKLLAAFQQDMKDMAAFMKREHLSSALQREVLDYYINDWEKMGGTDYRNILKLCDQVTLRSDAILNIFGPTFMMCPILTQCDISLLRMMGRAVRSYYFLKGTVIVEKDDIISDLYLVDHGNVEIKESRDNDESSVTLGKGSIFGNLEGPATLKCPMSVTATNRIHLLQINGKLFHDIIKDFPSVIQLLDTYRSINKNYIEGDLPTITSKQKKQSFISPVINRHRRLLKFFHFESPFTQIYFITISLSCVFADVYNAGFLDNRVGLIVALYVQDVAFCCKFLIQYFLPYVSEDDEDITEELLKIRKAYFTTEFKIDVLSCLPIELFCFLSHEHTWMLFACLRLNRVLRIGTVYTSIRRYYKYFFTNLTITTIFCVLIWFTLFIHVSTCLWHFIGIMEEASARKTSWFYKDNGRRWCTNKYVCSLYFVLTTFTQNGVGDILPKKQKEVIFVSILQMVSTMMYMVYVGEFSNLIQYHSFRSFSYYCKYLELQEFLKNNRVSRNLVIKLVNKYSLHLWQESRGVQVPYFLKNAPNCFKLKVMSAAYLHHLAGHHVFDCCEPAFLRQLVGHLRLYTYNKGTYVVKENEITNAMYIIHTGRVAETRGSETTSKVYYSGEYFGVVQGLVRDYPHTHSYQSISKSQILTLHIGDWEYLLDHFPNSKDCIFKYLTYDDDSSGNKEIDKFNKRERKITIAGNYAYRKKKVNDSYKKPSGTFSRVSFQSQESRSVPTSSNLVESKHDDKEKADDNELKKMGLDNISPTSSTITEKAETSLDRLKLDDDDILYQPNNSASEENTQSDNIEMYELTTRSVEDYIDQKHRHNSLASLYDESTQAREKVYNNKLGSKEDETEGSFGNADKSASRNDGTEQNDTLVLNVDSKSSNESDSQTSISKRRQSKTHQPSI